MLGARVYGTVQFGYWHMVNTTTTWTGMCSFSTPAAVAVLSITYAYRLTATSTAAGCSPPTCICCCCPISSAVGYRASLQSWCALHHPPLRHTAPRATPLLCRLAAALSAASLPSTAANGVPCEWDAAAATAARRAARQCACQ